MSLPTFPEKPEGYSIEDSISQILTSIAMEEIGLSHIINAEGEKIQYVLGTLQDIDCPKPSIDEMLKVNESVKDMLKAVSLNQMFLFNKMSSAFDAYFKSQEKTKPIASTDNMISAGDTGAEIWVIQNLSVDIPFGKIISSKGDSIVHFTDTPEFIILNSGEFHVKYQLIVDNPGVEDGAPIDNTVELISSVQGVLDTFHVTEKNQLVDREEIVNLLVGDRIFIRVSQPEQGEFTVKEQYIKITKTK